MIAELQKRLQEQQKEKNRHPPPSRVSSKRTKPKAPTKVVYIFDCLMFPIICLFSVLFCVFLSSCTTCKDSIIQFRHLVNINNINIVRGMARGEGAAFLLLDVTCVFSCGSSNTSSQTF